MPVASRFRVWACFDDEERSDTYAEPVERCPECDTWLKADLLLAARESGA